ncbi:hypothetical protein [Leeia oryzae]|uniref:hypothetical protein n=1 Tax=Leeia oryzae TaxID=356662 RepID=UPI000379F0C9|nr:hypothetical protein [Leeia oryzae]
MFKRLLMLIVLVLPMLCHGMSFTGSRWSKFGDAYLDQQQTRKQDLWTDLYFAVPADDGSYIYYHARLRCKQRTYQMLEAKVFSASDVLLSSVAAPTNSLPRNMDDSSFFTAVHAIYCIGS